MLAFGCHLSTSEGFWPWGARRSWREHVRIFCATRAAARPRRLTRPMPRLAQLMVERFRPAGGACPHAQPLLAKPRRANSPACAWQTIWCVWKPCQLLTFIRAPRETGAEYGLGSIARLLNEVLAPEQTTTVLETMAGKGTEVGRTFEELAAIIERVERRP